MFLSHRVSFSLPHFRPNRNSIRGLEAIMFNPTQIVIQAFGIVLPMITKGLQPINLVEDSSGMCGVMLLLLGCGPWGILPLLLRFPHEGSRRTVFRGMPVVVSCGGSSTRPYQSRPCPCCG